MCWVDHLQSSIADFRLLFNPLWSNPFFDQYFECDENDYKDFSPDTKMELEVGAK